MHKHAHKIGKYDRNLRLHIITDIRAISIFSFEIIPMTTIRTMNASLIILNNKPEDELVIAFSPYIFLFSVSGSPVRDRYVLKIYLLDSQLV
jgi:hypothetical protein